ncbi:histidine protein methyltransferase 1 homolog [Ptychodera flava]|uniref:histidine protein methyltransferase 1 homolog n=1 Tax=Ptychodera flava TaxID=63121 RepID=UPI00396A67DE
MLAACLPRCTERETTTMDFKFNFEVEDLGEDGKEESRRRFNDNFNRPTQEKKLKKEEDIALAKEILLPVNSVALLRNRKPQEIKAGATSFRIVDSADVECKLKDDKDGHLLKAIAQHSDLLPNVYEGGLKVWECCLDLVEFLADAGVSFKDSRVLELGCGAALPGIFALQHGAEVFLQDYNEEVITEITMPNVVLNLGAESDKVNSKCRFFSGDWTLFEEMMVNRLTQDDDKFDIILTSETIYNTDSNHGLYSVIKSLLKHTGVVYLAAKTHYFGVGGGTRLFEELVNRQGEFTTEVCRTYTEGVQREILMMKWK